MSDERILMIDEITDQNGKIRPTFISKNDSTEVPNGCYAGIDSNGRKIMHITYLNGVVVGPFKEYWSNGSLATEGHFQDGLQEGTWHYYDMHGELTDLIHFCQGKEVRE